MNELVGERSPFAMLSFEQSGHVEGERCFDE